MSDLKNDKLLTVRGVVTEALPSTLFRVKIEDKNEEEKKPAHNATSARNAVSTAGWHSVAGGGSLAYLGGKMRMHRIKGLIGDGVEVVLDPYGGKGRIIKRL